MPINGSSHLVQNHSPIFLSLSLISSRRKKKETKEKRIMGEAMEFVPYNNGFSKALYETKHVLIEKQNHDELDEDSWFEEEIDVDLKWSFSLNR